MKILLAGDTHGNMYHMQNVMAHACRVEADMVFQLGDFGYGWHFANRRDAFCQGVSKLVQQTGNIATGNREIDVYWLDGNHENHTSLRIVCKEMEDEEDGTYMLEPGVFYVPRGTLLEWDGIRFLVVGGATSVDRDHRKPGASWWPEERLTDEEVEFACAADADVLLSHDFPWECNIVDRHLSPYWGERAQRDTMASRQQISRIVRETGVRRVYHGHLHVRYDEDIQVDNGIDGTHTVHVTGLDCDNNPMDLSTLLIDTEELRRELRL